jgi:hypothetical protein
MPHIDWGGVIPAINLLVLAGGGLYALAVLKTALKQMLELLNGINLAVINHETRLSRAETKIDDHDREFDRVRNRLDHLMDKPKA